MRKTKLGGSDLEVTPICFGCWAIVGGFNWGQQDRQQSLDTLRAAYDAGINFFDTAEGYGNGASEELVREALWDVRDDIVIASKISPRHFAQGDVKKACEESLTRLGTDHIDLYQLHWPSRDVCLEETIDAMQRLKEEGKVRCVGVSNFGKEDLIRATELWDVTSNQLAYNLFFRAIEYEILPFCIRKGIPVLCYSPILQGMLAGKFTRPEEVPDDRARTRHYSCTRPLAKHDEPGVEAYMFEAVEEIREVADGLGVSMAHLSMAWLLHQDGVGAVISGGRTVKQAKGNAEAAELKLDADVLDRLDDITFEIKRRMGDNADMWRSESRIR